MVIKKLKWIFLVSLFCLFLVGNLLPLIGPKVLLQQYYIGGIISGVFAFGAFGVAIVTYLEQKKTTDLQRFETTFFNMLNLQEQIVEGLMWEGLHPEQDSDVEASECIGTKWGSIKKVGRQVFEYLWRDMRFKVEVEDENGDNDLDYCIYYKGLHKTLGVKGPQAYQGLSEVSAFDHYFRHMYRIIKFVDTSRCLKNTEKYKYTSIVRATLSRYELVWIYYNCLFGAGKEKFKPLVEKYSLLKNLREDLLAYSKDDEIDNEGNISDYDKYMTDEENCTNKYHLQAFVNPGDKGKYEQLCEYYKTKIKSRLRTSQI